MRGEPYTETERHEDCGRHARAPKLVQPLRSTRVGEEKAADFARRRRRSLARRLAPRLAGDDTALVRPPAAWRARRCALLCERFCAHVTLHCLSLVVVVVVVMVLLLVQMLLLARRGSATRLDARREHLTRRAASRAAAIAARRWRWRLEAVVDL